MFASSSLNPALCLFLSLSLANVVIYNKLIMPEFSVWCLIIKGKLLLHCLSPRIYVPPLTADSFLCCLFYHCLSIYICFLGGWIKIHKNIIFFLHRFECCPWSEMNLFKFLVICFPLVLLYSKYYFFVSYSSVTHITHAMHTWK